MRLGANRSDDEGRPTAASKPPLRFRLASFRRRDDSARPSPMRREHGLRDDTGRSREVDAGDAAR